MLFDPVNSPARCDSDSNANNRGMPRPRRLTHIISTTAATQNTLESEAAALKAIFEDVARLRRISQERFGLDFEIGSQGMVWQYLNGHRPLNLSVALRFARGLAVPLSAFSPRLAAELEAAGISLADPAIAIIRATQVPVVGAIRSNDPQGLYSTIEPIEARGFVTYPTLRSSARAYRVIGDVHRPRVKPGEYVIVEPDVVCTPGDEVLVVLKDERVMIKVLHVQRNGFVELLSLNDSHPPISLDLVLIESIMHVAGIAKEILYHTPPS